MENAQADISPDVMGSREFTKDGSVIINRFLTPDGPEILDILRVGDEVTLQLNGESFKGVYEGPHLVESPGNDPELLARFSYNNGNPRSMIMERDLFSVRKYLTNGVEFSYVGEQNQMKLEATVCFPPSHVPGFLINVTG